MPITDFTIAWHASQRVLDMQLEPHEVVECLENPVSIKPCVKYPDMDLYSSGRITCSVARDSKTLVTVLWRFPDGWRQDILERGQYGGREYRGEVGA